MKKIFSKLFIFGALSATLMSCDEDRIVYNGDQSAYSFGETSYNLPLTPTDANSVTVQIGVTADADTDRVVPLSINSEMSTASADQYTVSDAFIPAGQYVGYATITGNFDNVPDGVTETLVLTIDSDQVQVLDDKGMTTVSLFRSCPTDLAGTYSVTTTYGYHDFLPEYGTNTMEVEITEEQGDNTYKVADFSGGLYSEGPYADQYGTGAPSAANARDLVFTVNCGNIDWTGQADPWGAIVETEGGVNSYNAETGVLTISWTAVGYGENGVSVYTPL